AGKLTVSARGARKKIGKYTAASQLLAFSELDLYERNGRWSIREGRVVELFDGLRRDILLLSVGAYFAELLEAVSDVDYIDPELLKLGLRGLHVLSGGVQDPRLVKAAFELRLMGVSGYAPELSGCFQCTVQNPVDPRLGLHVGQIHCPQHRPKGAGTSLKLDASSLLALRHVLAAPESRVFAFTLGEQGLEYLSTAAEGYVLAQLERSFRTLDFLKQLW
ncbi:MAG: DNA repair protein RecO, partial [Oscillospiraceae bacterium]|nr:DNA repair protein RecO [Oscillospiraceae bacterium]